MPHELKFCLVFGAVISGFLTLSWVMVRSRFCRPFLFLLNAVHYGAPAIPIASLVLFYSFILNVRLTFGLWPYYGHPVPLTNPQIQCHGVFMGFGLFTAFFSPALWVLAGIVLALAKVRARYGIRFITMAVTYTLGWMLVRSDPGGFFEWLFD